MKTYHFPYIAVSLGVVLFLIVLQGSQAVGDGYKLPLLTLLIVSEGAFIITAIGVYTGIKYRTQVENKLLYTIATILCLLLSIRFLTFGLTLWPTLSAA